ncbi:MAG: tRNA-dihydrouridine synthase family protein [Candidatus Woesearchaeota archaeon]
MILYFAPINLLGNHAYRHLILRHGADMVFTELILYRDLFGKEGDHDKLAITKGDETKTVVQVGTGEPDRVLEMVDHIMRHHPEVPEINLNMDCPQSTLVRKVSCGGLLNDITAMQAVTTALVHACEEHGVLPSVKIRTGPRPNRFKLDEYVKSLKRAGITKIYVHGRTLGQGYHQPANHSPLAKAVKKYPEIRFVANGDIDSYDSARRLEDETDCSDIMIGRAALHNPSIFRNVKQEVKAKTSSFSPLENDPNLIREENGSKSCSEEKKSLVKEFVEISTRNELPVKTAKRNLMMMLKGISDMKAVFKDLNEAGDYSELTKILYQHPFI